MTKEIFIIAESYKLTEKVNTIGEKSKVSESIFWKTLDSKVKEITKDREDKYEETLKKAKEFIALGNSLSVSDIWFKIDRKKVTNN